MRAIEHDTRKYHKYLLKDEKAKNADFQFFAAIRGLEMLRNVEHYCSPPSNANAKQC